MTTHSFPLSPVGLLAALGLLACLPMHSLAAVDTSQWKCETCPFEKAGTSGSVDIGVGAVSERSARFGDFTGLDDKGAFLIAGGGLRYRSGDGYFADLAANELGLDSRSFSAVSGREGRYTVRLGYAEIPRHLAEGAMTPFRGVGSGVLTLPAGFPAATTGAMPLAGTLQPVDIGAKRTRYELGASLAGSSDWSYRVKLSHEVRDGTQRMAGAFFATAAQLVAPVDQVTNQLEVSTTYAGRRWQATLGYLASIFRNDKDSLTWANPLATGAIDTIGHGRLALAPDNQFHQLQLSLGYDLAPRTRASADIAVGRMTQDEAYLPATLNPGLAVPGLPSLSLHGRAKTFDASLRLSSAPVDGLRLNASYTRSERDNDTPVASYPGVSNDMFLGLPRSNQAFSFQRDRTRLGADYRGTGSRWQVAGGLDHDATKRPQQEANTTRETTLWARVSAQPLKDVSVALKAAHAERSHSDYRSVAWIDPAENPLLRKFNQAERMRDTGGLRLDWAVSETVNLGLNADIAYDDYAYSAIGLIDGRSASVGADLSWAVSDETQLRAFAQGERIRSKQAGSQLFAQADWWAHSRDAIDVVGVGIKHQAMKGKLELAADLTWSRSNTDVTVATGGAGPQFPSATTALDSLKLQATYKLSDKLSLLGAYWFERYESADWRLDGVLPATVPNLLALGEQAPRYRVNLLRLALRYRF
ncbi:MAG: MtrB/PioB family decaheme-associated outer membrane protein [Burkholderiales bacterium]|nr:MtrB/PioB family decaheme-associated outer membrane protein [Burkholderiales bacterium]